MSLTTAVLDFFVWIFALWVAIWTTLHLLRLLIALSILNRVIRYIFVGLLISPLLYFAGLGYGQLFQAASKDPFLAGELPEVTVRVVGPQRPQPYTVLAPRPPTPIPTAEPAEEFYDPKYPELFTK